MTVREQLDSFYQYASAQIERHPDEESTVEDLMEGWRATLNDEQFVDMLNERWRAVQRGEAQDAREAIQKINAEFGISINE